jgi:hypothetical protein
LYRRHGELAVECQTRAHRVVNHLGEAAQPARRLRRRRSASKAALPGASGSPSTMKGP